MNPGPGPCPPDCKSRTIGCQSVCLRYFLFTLENDARLKKQHTDGRTKADFETFRHVSNMKRRNANHRKQKG